MVTGEDGRHGLHVTVIRILRFELGYVTTRPLPAWEQLVLDSQAVLNRVLVSYFIVIQLELKCFMIFGHQDV